MQSRAHEAPRREATVLVGIGSPLRGEREVAKRIRGRGRRRPRDLPVLAVQVSTRASDGDDAQGTGGGGPPRASDGQSAVRRSGSTRAPRRRRATAGAYRRGPRICRAARSGTWRGTCVLTLPPSVRIYLAVGQVDMRRGHDGLAAIVRGQWKVD